MNEVNDVQPSGPHGAWERAMRVLRSPHYEGHSAPQSRRDFLRLGALTFGAAASAPWWRTALASGDASIPTIPFLTFDLAGGAALPGNFLVGKRGGPLDLCGESPGQVGYRELGWNPRESEALDTSFGLPMSTKRSKIREGLRAELPQALFRENGDSVVRMASILHFALDDTDRNQISSMSMVASAGLVGSRLRVGLGQRNSLSGGLSRGVLENGRFKPKVISSTNDLVRLVSLGAALDGLPNARRRQLLAGWSNRLREAAARRGILDDGLATALDQTVDLGRELPDCNPMNNPTFRNIYQLNNSGDTRAGVEAGIVMATLNRWTGPGVITIGNCDYHDGTGTTGDRVDLQIGRSIGRALRAAYELRTPLFFQIITDGGVYARANDSYDRLWTGDNPQHSMTVMGFYHPTKTIELSSLQLGAYTDAGLVDQTTPYGANPQTAALVSFANYLSVCGSLDVFERASGRRLSNIGGESSLVFQC